MWGYLQWGTSDYLKLYLCEKRLFFYKINKNMKKTGVICTNISGNDVTYVELKTL